MKPKAKTIMVYDSSEICKAVEYNAKFNHDLWYYWTIFNDVNGDTISTVNFEYLIEKLRELEENELAANLESIVKELDPSDKGIFVSYFW